VSIVIPTYNRRADLARTLAAVSRQTYPNLEILVVNDAGADVSDVVAAVPGARYLTMPQNAGVVRAELFGIEHASGEYIQLLADDDVLQPDHVMLLVGAMLHSGAAMAHGNCLIRTQEPAGNDVYRTTGFCTVVFNSTVTPTIALIATAISGNALMVHRRVFDEVGPYRADCMLADQEFQMRALQRFAFVYSDNMTAEWRSRGKENFSANADSSPEQQRIYERLHPRPGRPFLEQRRRETVERIASRPKGGVVFPATIAVDFS
jgi:glycosyltransferase involved in cell wall biosynthesis